MKKKSFVEKISGSMDLFAGGCFFAVMALIIANIIMRGIFKQPILGNYELVGYLTAMGVSFALAHCAAVDGHIAVGFVAERLPQGVQKVVSLLVSAMSVCLWGIVIWSMYSYAVSTRTANLVSATARIAVYPIVGLVAVGMAGFWLVLLLQLGRPVQEIILAAKLNRNTKAAQVTLAEKAV